MTTATSSMLDRAAASHTDWQCRVFIGPHQAFIDYELYAAGEPVTLPIEATVTATTGIGVEPVDIEVDDATGYSNGPSMLFVSSPVSGMAWVRYDSRDSDTFYGCVRVWGQSGGIAAGAKVTQWTEITSLVTGDPTQDEDFTGKVSDWSWGLQGVHYNHDLMAEDATVLIMVSVSPEAGLTSRATDYFIAGLGFVRKWEAYGDANLVRAWNCTVESIRTFVDSYQVEGRTFGRVNLAENQPVTASPALANPLVLQALNEPEWRGVIGTTDADKLTDSQIDTGPYVSQLQPSQTPETPGDSGGANPGVLFEEIYIDGDYFWFQMRLAADSPNYNTTGVSMTNFALTNEQTVFVDSNVPDWPREIPVQGGASNYARMKDITFSEDEDRAIFTNDRNRFQREYTVSTSLRIYDVREMPGFGNDGLKGRDLTSNAAGGWWQLRYCVGRQSVRDMIPWGAVTSSDWWNGANDEDESGDQWSGDAVAVWSEGNSIRRYPVSTDTNTDDDWTEETDPNPVDRRTDTDPVFVSVELADIPTALSEDITTVSHGVGDILPLTEAEYLQLQVGSDVIIIRIDTEQMRIRPQAGNSTQMEIVERGYNSTTIANHDADTPVYYLYDGGFIRLPWPQSLEWRRWARFDIEAGIGGLPRYIARVPHTWEVWGSQEDDARYPGGSGYRADWIGGHALTTTIQTEPLNMFMAKASFQRVPLRHVMMIIKRMAVDNTYAMVNELRVWRAGLSGAVTQYEGIGNVVMHYLAQFPGTSRVIVDDDVFEGTSGDVSIAGGSLGTVLDDLGESYGFIVEYTRDNKLHLRRNPFHPKYTRDEIFANLGLEMIEGTLNPQRATYPSRIGADQVKVALHDVAALRIYEGVYPPTSRFGGLRTVERTMVGGDIGQATAIAQQIYLSDPTISREIEFSIAGLFPELRPLMRVLVYDYTDDADYYGRWEDCIIKSVRRVGGKTTRLLCQVYRQA